MTSPSCFVVPAGELTDALSAIVWLPFAALAVGSALRTDWEGLYRRYRRRQRITAIRAAKRAVVGG